MVMRRMPKLSTCDKCLIAGFVVGLLLTAIMGLTLLRKDLIKHRMYMYDHEDHEGGEGPHHGASRQLGLKEADFDEVDCDVEDVEESDDDIDCTRNSKGEWCAGPGDREQAESTGEVANAEPPIPHAPLPMEKSRTKRQVPMGHEPRPVHEDRDETEGPLGRHHEKPGEPSHDKPDGGHHEKPDGGHHEKPDGGHHENPDGGQDEKPEERHHDNHEEGNDEGSDGKHQRNLADTWEALGRLLRGHVHEISNRRPGPHVEQHETDSSRPDGQHEDDRKKNHHSFRCMRLKVSLRPAIQGQPRHAQAYENMTTLTNFPGCSFSRCGEDEEKNKADLEEVRQEWLAQKNSKIPGRCQVNRNNPSQVIMMAHKLQFRRFLRSAGFQATFWSFVFAAVCGLILCVRHCCLRGKVSTTNKAKPANVSDAYVVPPTPSVLEKEREAFGLPPVSVGNESPMAPPKKDFLLLVPPEYSEIMKATPVSMVGLPPDYSATIGEMKSIPSEKSIPMVD